MASVYTLVIANTRCPISLQLQDQRLAVSNNHHLPRRVSGEPEPIRKARTIVISRRSHGIDINLVPYVTEHAKGTTRCTGTQ